MLVGAGARGAGDAAIATAYLILPSLKADGGPPPAPCGTFTSPVAYVSPDLVARPYIKGQDVLFILPSFWPTAHRH